MNKDHRQEYHRAWSRLTPPLRPDHDVVAAVRKQIDGLPGRTLLLGVTPELADIASDLVAVDRNFPMVANLWPGNTASRRAMVGDWLKPNFTSGSFSACIGDGSLCSLRYPHDIMVLLHELIRVLRPEGRFICRVYASPDTAETVSALRDAATSGAVRNFHAFKFRLGMALAAQRPEPQIGVDGILNAFNTLFGDRDGLVRATGWNREQIDTIDFYRGSTVVLSFPTQDQLLSLVSGVLPNPRFVPAGTYELAERCPLLIAERT